MTDKQAEETLQSSAEDIVAEERTEQAAEQATETVGDAAQKELAAEPDPEEEALNTRFMRLSADFANYKKRVEKEKSDIYRLANEKLMLDLIPVIDNIERALDHADESPKEKFVEGVEMVFNSFITVLKSAGLKEIEATGQPFDHNAHHAVLTEPSEEHDSDIVTAVLQKGYTLNDKVIRPSMVKVSE